MTSVPAGISSSWTRRFEYPEGYNPGKSALPQFALVVTTRTFNDQKIPDLPTQVREADTEWLPRW